MLKRQILTLHMFIEIFQFQLTFVWFSGCMQKKIIGKTFVYSMGVQKGNVGQNQQNLADISLFCFTPTFSWHSAQENS